MCLPIFSKINLTTCCIPLKTIPSTARARDVPCLSPHYKPLSRTFFEIPACWLTNRTPQTLYKLPFDFESHDHMSPNTETHNKSLETDGICYEQIKINFNNSADPINLLHINRRIVTWYICGKVNNWTFILSVYGKFNFSLKLITLSRLHVFIHQF